MKTSELISGTSYSIKLIALYILMLADLYLFVHIIYVDFSKELQDSNSLNELEAENEALAGVCLNGVHFIIQIALVFWFFFAIWKTFLFRFGLLWQLFIKSFPIFTLLLIFNIIFFLVEKTIRMVYTNTYYIIIIHSLSLMLCLSLIRKRVSRYGMMAFMLLFSGLELLVIFWVWCFFICV